MDTLRSDIASTLGIVVVTEVAADTAVISAIMASRGKASWRFVAGAGAVAVLGVVALLRAVPYIEETVMALAMRRLHEADECACQDGECACESCGC